MAGYKYVNMILQLQLPTIQLRLQKEQFKERDKLEIVYGGIIYDGTKPAGSRYIIQDIKLHMNAKHQQSLMKQLQVEQHQLMDFLL